MGVTSDSDRWPQPIRHPPTPHDDEFADFDQVIGSRFFHPSQSAGYPPFDDSAYHTSVTVAG